MGNRLIGKLIAAGWLGASIHPCAAHAAALDISPFVVRDIVPDVHILTTPDDYFGPAIGNIVVIERSRDILLVDSGGNIGEGRKAAAYVRSITPKPVTTVVVTHWHGDHTSGLAGLKETWPRLKIIATSATRAGMLRPGHLLALRPSSAADEKLHAQLKVETDDYKDLLTRADTPEDRRQRIRKALHDFDAFDTDFKGTYLVLPTQTFETRVHLADPRTPVDIFYFGRANTAGDAVVWLPKQRIVATGDIVVSPVPFGINSYPQSWLTVLGKIKDLRSKVLIPGHGQPMTDSKYIDSLAASISIIREEVETAAKRGESLAEIKNSADLSNEVKRFGTDDRLKRSVPPLWTEPMVINAYKEAKGLPIRQLRQDPDPK